MLLTLLVRCVSSTVCLGVDHAIEHCTQTVRASHLSKETDLCDGVSSRNRASAYHEFRSRDEVNVIHCKLWAIINTI